MQQAVDHHHPNKKDLPKLTIPISHKEHQKLHNNVPLDTALSKKMRQYDKVTTIIVTMKNWSSSYQKDFDKPPDIGLKRFLQLKAILAKELKQLVKNDLPKVSHIKGFGSRYLAGILAYAHPSRFPSLRKFLFYCGYTQASREKKNYCRRIKPIMFNLVGQIIKAKDPKYYNFYKKLKEDAKAKHPGKPKIVLHRVAVNRTATFILKEVYRIFRSIES